VGQSPPWHTEQSRARYPDVSGFVERDDQQLFYEVYGDGEDSVFLLPTWSLLHSRHWRMQIPYLSRHFRLLTMDGLGNGRAARCRDPRRYSPTEFARDCLAVMDATATGRAVMVSLSRGGQFLLELARLAPERVAGAAFLGPMFPYGVSQWSWLLHPRLEGGFDRRWPVYRWWLRMNAVHWRRNYPAFCAWFITRCLPEPHSTKAVDDGLAWALETDPETLIATARGGWLRGRRRLRALAAGVSCPVLVIHGDRDRITPLRDGRALARLARGRLEVVPGSGHFPHARKPVPVNMALRRFAEQIFGRPGTYGVGSARPIAADPVVDPPSAVGSGVGPTVAAASVGGRRVRRRALYVSSPIGLGHAQRDVAIARELRRLHPELEIDWLAQDPVTRVLEAEGERIHPASAYLANESRHFESESAEHDLHCFHALRRMDEILTANFMLFHDVVRERRYDVWIADEAWDLDYYLHENPREKRAPFVWMTDFVGFLPMDDANPRERFLTADYNADMVDHVKQHPHVRDHALFVGNPDDIIERPLGPHLPMIREWTVDNFDFTGYVTGFNMDRLGERTRLRAELGYRGDEPICIVTVGGTGVGADLLRRVIAAFPDAKRRVPTLRMIVVTGPRIEPASLPVHPGLEVVSYVHNLYRHLAACDLAVIQGGLTTAMELTAYKRPFLYFPLRHHFEQNFHVRHRLERYGAGRRMDFDHASPELISSAIAEEIGREVTYRDVETDGAARAAHRIAELL
jgi:pimeloyl-ACP methyl ester carboxylesterase/predicted glycosyltransferase